MLTANVNAPPVSHTIGSPEANSDTPGRAFERRRSRGGRPAAVAAAIAAAVVAVFVAAVAVVVTAAGAVAAGAVAGGAVAERGDVAELVGFDASAPRAKPEES
jgi:hypothetical protein